MRYFFTKKPEAEYLEIVRTLGVRIVQAALFLFLLSVIVFFLARLSPGDPLLAYYGEAVEHMSAAQKTAAIERLSLDKPILVQYLSWAGEALHGDFGISYQYKQPVTAVIGKVWRNTLLLGGISYLLTFVFSILVGIFCAMREGRLADKILYKAGTVTSVIPTFFVALILILVFGVNLHLLPTGGAYSIRDGGGFLDRAIHLILPVTVMIFSHIWYYAYMFRNKLIEELRMDYVSLLKVKGVSARRILFRHCLRNILPVIITIMAVSVPHILAGTYVVEMVFGYPGMGTLAFESARYHDYNMLSVLCLITGFSVVAANLAGQELSELLDPRMRHDKIAVPEDDDKMDLSPLSGEGSVLPCTNTEGHRHEGTVLPCTHGHGHEHEGTIPPSTHGHGHEHEGTVPPSTHGHGHEHERTVPPSTHTHPSHTHTGHTTRKGW
jgi:peptide/nickel transport system permease protein